MRMMVRVLGMTVLLAGQMARAEGPATAAAMAAAATQPNLRVTNESRVYQMVKDAVVNISSTRIVAARVSSGDQVFDQFFGGQIRQVPATSLGSGFVIHPSGYIITNEHV